jgi:hypothetical protein
MIGRPMAALHYSFIYELRDTPAAPTPLLDGPSEALRRAWNRSDLRKSR